MFLSFLCLGPSEAQISGAWNYCPPVLLLIHTNKSPGASACSHQAQTHCGTAQPLAVSGPLSPATLPSDSSPMRSRSTLLMPSKTLATPTSSGSARGPAPMAVTEGRYKLFPRTTVVSVDAIGSYDHVSRQAMLEGLRSKPALEPLLPFARQFYDCSSVYTWLDVDGGEHHIAQGGEEEQGDP